MPPFFNFHSNHILWSVKDRYDLTTYPELPNSISKIPSYEELASDKISNYTKTWKANDEISVTLEMTYFKDTGIRIAIQYAVLAPVTQTRGQWS